MIIISFYVNTMIFMPVNLQNCVTEEKTENHYSLQPPLGRNSAFVQQQRITLPGSAGQLKYKLAMKNSLGYAKRILCFRIY